MRKLWMMVLLCAHGPLWAAAFDPLAVWPLCGRISDNPPPGWSESLGCPSSRWGDPAFGDYPLSSTFGPRQKASADFRYDFHRGIDIPTAFGTPVFAVTDGVVRIAGYDQAYSDPLVQIRHLRPGASSCAPDGCYTSNYMHLSSWVVSAGAQVSKGQLIGYSGAGESNFAHLHFEIRDARAGDLYSAWERDGIHPLRVLPYQGGAGGWTFSLLSSTRQSASSARVTVSLRQDTGLERLDLTRIELVPLNGKGQPIAQAGNTPNADGYYVDPSFFDFELMNRQYTHKNSTAMPWSSFADCPYAYDHPGAYDSNVHLDRQAADSASVHEFNGARIAPAPHSAASAEYRTDASFTLTGINPSNYCFNVRADSAQGAVASQKLCVKNTKTLSQVLASLLGS